MTFSLLAWLCAPAFAADPGQTWFWETTPYGALIGSRVTAEAFDWRLVGKIGGGRQGDHVAPTVDGRAFELIQNRVAEFEPKGRAGQTDAELLVAYEKWEVDYLTDELHKAGRLTGPMPVWDKAYTTKLGVVCRLWGYQHAGILDKSYGDCAHGDFVYRVDALDATGSPATHEACLAAITATIETLEFPLGPGTVPGRTATP